jgi:endonuclease III
MKFYEIELRRESYITVVVSAYSEDEAADKLMNNLEEYVDGDADEANWDITDIQEAERTEEDRAE